MTSAINFDQVDVTIKGKPILQAINGSIEAGLITGVLGPSGAGKTTLIRSLLGLQSVHRGKIEVFGTTAGHKALHSQIGYVTQAASVYTDLTVDENLRYFASLLGQPASQTHQVLKTVDLEPQQHQLVGSLSGGQMARVSLAVALLGQPKLLVLDEPTVGLDPLLRQNLWNTFRTLAQQGTTIIITSHAMDEAQKCDQIWFLRQGRLLAAETSASILRQTKSQTMEQAFLKLSTGEDV